MIYLVILLEILLSIIVLTYPITVSFNYYSLYSYVNISLVVLFIFILITIINSIIFKNKYNSEIDQRTKYFNFFCIFLTVFFILFNCFNESFDNTQIIVLLFLYNLLLNINDLIYSIVLKKNISKVNSYIIFNIIIYCLLLVFNTNNINNFLNIHTLFGLPLFINVFIKKIFFDRKRISSYIYLNISLIILSLNVFFPTVLNKGISYVFIKSDISKEFYYISIDTYNKTNGKNVSYLHKLTKSDFNTINNIYLNDKTIYNIKNLNDDLKIILKNRNHFLNIWVKNKFIEKLNIDVESKFGLNISNSEIEYLYFASQKSSLSLFETNINNLESKYELFVYLYDSNVDESNDSVIIVEKK